MTALVPAWRLSGWLFALKFIAVEPQLGDFSADVQRLSFTPLCCAACRVCCCSRVDEAADVYSLGCILYECLAKMQPFGHLADGKSFNVLFKVRQGWAT